MALKKFSDLFELQGKKIYDPGLWVVVSLGSVLSLGILFILLPLLARLLRGGVIAKGESRKAQLSTLSCFGFVGFAFMAVEIALMQRFTLFLGHPSYSLLVILFVVLLTTAIGARLSERFDIARLGKIMLAGGVILGALTAVYGLVLGDVLRALIGLDRPIRIVITALLVAPCGLLMGVMIPSVVRVLGAANSPLVPWGWGVNGATSVIGTSIATIIAMYGGFTATFLVGAGLYAVAGLLGRSVASQYLTKERAKSEPKPEAKSDAKPVAASKAEEVPETEKVDADRVQAQRDKRAADGKSAAKSEPKAAAKSDSKTEAKTGTKSDSKAEAKSDSKAEAKTDAKSEPKTNGTSDSNGKSEVKSDAKAESKPAPSEKAETTPESKTDAKSDA